MSEEAFKKECLNSYEFKILEMYGVLQRQILFCGTCITAAAREVSTLSVAFSMDLGAGGFPFLKAYLLGGFLWMLSHAPRPGGKKVQRGDICQSSFRLSPASLHTLLISVPLCPLASSCSPVFIPYFHPPCLLSGLFH